MIVLAIIAVLIVALFAADYWHSERQKRALARPYAAPTIRTHTNTNYDIVDARARQTRNSTMGL